MDAVLEELQQGTDEWRKARVGHVTASRIYDIVAKLKGGGYKSSRKDYLMEKIIERMTGEPQDNGYVSLDMQRGIDLEPQARAAYALRTDNNVQTVGFIPHPMIALAGASPDGLVNGDGEVQFKVPKSSTHWATVKTGEIDLEYVAQMQFGMACTGRSWCDYVSYDPRFPARHQLKIIRVNRSEPAIRELEAEVRKFLSEVEAELACAP